MEVDGVAGGARQDHDDEESLAALVRAAVRSVPGVDAAGVTLTESGGVDSCAPSAPAVRTLDRLQGDWYEGPCITAADDPPPDGMVLVEDLDGPDAVRWPGFARYALDAGYRSILSIGLGTAHGTSAALNLYAARPHVFHPEARDLAGVFAAHAATLMNGRSSVTRERLAPSDRDLVSQAVGILVGRFGAEPGEAFTRLVRASEDTGLGLVDLARRLHEVAGQDALVSLDLNGLDGR